MRTWILEVSGMHSEGCIDRIVQALSSLPGVVDATVSLLHSKVTVQCDERLPCAGIVKALEAAGYRPCEWSEDDSAAFA